MIDCSTTLRLSARYFTSICCCCAFSRASEDDGAQSDMVEATGLRSNLTHTTTTPQPVQSKRANIYAISPK